jgi:Ser/Thr protein kinase RdoA (MazF antagonist)
MRATMSRVIPAGNVAAALSAWPYRVESVAPLAGGWNSATWLVVTAQGRYVAKLVDHLDTPGLASGMRIAEFLAARGLACGAPARTRDGELTISLPEGTLALLRHEPGIPPDLTQPGQVRRAGRVLARAHQALRDFPAGSDPRYRWPWFTEGYAAQMPQIGPQLAHLDCLVKARWLANAIYFSSRIARGIKRGSDSPAANQDGLAAAYAGMTASS